MKTKRFLALVLAATLTLGLLLTGCGQQASEPSVSVSETTAATAGSVEETTAQVKTIKAAVSGFPAPYVTINENNEPDGYDVRILKEVFNRLPQYELEFVVADFGSIFTGVATGLYDVVCNNISYSAERAESYLYSYPYNSGAYVFVSKDGSVTSFEDAAGKTTQGNPGVAVTIAIEKWNEQNPDKAINIEFVEQGGNVAQIVYDGVKEFVILDKGMYELYEREFQFGLKAVDLPEENARAIAENAYIYFLFALNNDALRQDVNAVLKEMRDDGTIKKISEEVLGFDATPPADQYNTPIN